jgi:nucleoside-diphosphate-sugar epimerase
MLSLAHTTRIQGRTAVQVFVTGATGVLGRPVVRLLREAGNTVRGLARSPSNEELLRRLGAEPVRGDLFDPASISAAVAGADAILHLATKVPPRSRSTKAGAWDENQRIRIEGTRNLVDAALAGGATTFLYPSLAFVYADGGDAWISAETAPADPTTAVTATLTAEAEVARFAAGGGRGISLRMGYFYGPEAESTLDTLALARRGAAFLTGAGDAFYPAVWVDDAATAVIAALRSAPTGVYDVVDDEPLTRRDLAKAIAEAAGRPIVLRPPVWLVKLVGGRQADFMVRSHRVSSARFKEVTGWSPQVRDARAGWRLIGQAMHQPQHGPA